MTLNINAVYSAINNITIAAHPLMSFPAGKNVWAANKLKLSQDQQKKYRFWIIYSQERRMHIRRRQTVKIFW